MEELKELMMSELPLSARYTGAWSEINARLQSRQLVNLYYTTAIIVSVGAIFAKADFDETTIFSIISLLLLAITWSFVLWVRHNDGIIGLLGTFCRACEQVSDPYNDKGIPSWHTDEHSWITEAYVFRRYTDYALCISLLLSTIPSWAAAWLHQEHKESFLALLFLLVGAAGIAAIKFVWKGHQMRMNIREGKFDNSSGTWRFRRGTSNQAL